MITTIDDTHDARLQSWLDSATDFPIQNLPLGRFLRQGDHDWRLGVAIGDQIVDLHIASGQDFLRPRGQLKAPDAVAPTLGACARLDYELELGIVIGQPSAMGDSVAIGQAEDHVFGLALFNDWSARDIQGWEYQPLGPFLSKNFASSLSPWIVTMEALAPFRAPFTRSADNPQPLPYLDSGANRQAGAIDIELILRGYCRREGYRRIGFGECRGTVLAARSTD